MLMQDVLYYSKEVYHVKGGYSHWISRSPRRNWRLLRGNGHDLELDNGPGRSDPDGQEQSLLDESGNGRKLFEEELE
jgi:hypothetical protein